MSNKQMTAVEWLEEQFIWMIEDGVDWADAFHSVMAKIDQAKQMEKEQAIDLISNACMFLSASFHDNDFKSMTHEDIYKNYYNGK